MLTFLNLLLIFQIFKFLLKYNFKRLLKIENADIFDRIKITPQQEYLIKRMIPAFSSYFLKRVQ